MLRLRWSEGDGEEGWSGSKGERLPYELSLSARWCYRRGRGEQRKGGGEKKGKGSGAEGEKGVECEDSRYWYIKLSLLRPREFCTAYVCARREGRHGSEGLGGRGEKKRGGENGRGRDGEAGGPVGESHVGLFTYDSLINLLFFDGV